ncbi:ParB/RepB/Spo0J family partition protein [Komagataeibacter sp. FNDCR2]|uniref:ParB/RepB/Spo0J family partition protein n=1 Tax=Komagataeibacter sp. FNDCR2 TaxID=2878682 RepID=UPI001E4D20A2|nr:ParB/RepB/Spo0J family partition protein [Komagataeibacter sp. FNDCR2]MCE2576773.1 ParB/RepB/Spo0J family partition protein [Komagataeibacter sp. FNDCR2]
MTRRFKARGASPFLTAQAGLMSKVETPFLNASRFNHTFEVPLDKVSADPSQPRKIFDQQELDQLADSFRLHGQLQPILLRPEPGKDGEWIIVAGERRWRAAVQLGWPALLAIEHTGDHESASLVENLLRVDLSAVDEARGFKKLMDHNNWSQSEMARQLGLSQPRINRSLRILELPDEFLEKASELRIPVNVLVSIVREEDSSQQNLLMQQAMEGDLTVSAANQTRKIKSGPASPRAVGSVPSEWKKKLASSIKAIKRFSQQCSEMPHRSIILSQNDRDTLEAARETIDILLSGTRPE